MSNNYNQMQNNNQRAASQPYWQNYNPQQQELYNQYNENRQQFAGQQQQQPMQNQPVQQFQPQQQPIQQQYQQPVEQQYCNNQMYNNQPQQAQSQTQNSDESSKPSLLWLILSCISIVFPPLSIVALIGSIVGLVKKKESQTQYIAALIISIIMFIVLIVGSIVIIINLMQLQSTFGAVSSNVSGIAADSAIKAIS